LSPSSSGSSGSSSSGGSSSGPQDVHVDISVADLDGHEECVAKEEAAAHACPAPLLDMAAASTTAVCDSLHYMDVGIIGVGFAKTGAAACHLCGHKILCGSIRFKYIWKKKTNRPNGFIGIAWARYQTVSGQRHCTRWWSARTPWPQLTPIRGRQLKQPLPVCSDSPTQHAYISYVRYVHVRS
jgi:hypothetical protein